MKPNDLSNEYNPNIPINLDTKKLDIIEIIKVRMKIKIYVITIEISDDTMCS
tara:strand:- start:342 stop:497 length:156 start_codon:yes stop_codon:yes gene_type:complete